MSGVPKGNLKDDEKKVVAPVEEEHQEEHVEEDEPLDEETQKALKNLKIDQNAFGTSSQDSSKRDKKDKKASKVKFYANL